MDTTTTKYFASYTDMKIETTNTPSDLCYALQGLTNAQKADIRDMGFESMKSFRIDNIPTGLGYWLLVNYDHKRNELNVGSRIIEITPSKVHDVLGVPMGEITVCEKKHVRKGDVFREEWRNQSFRSRVIFVKNVIEKLKSYTGGGTLFKLNFLVVFNTIMGETTRSATVNQKFLTSIVNEDDISNMDWCSYIIACLKRTKERWNGKELYNGPLTFLAVLYAHEQQLRRSPEKAITPAIQYVTSGFLVDLEGSMHDNIQEGNQSTQIVEVQVQLETHIEYVEPQTYDDQTVVDQNVNVLQDKEDEDQDQFQSINPDYVLNLKLPIGPPSAQLLYGLSSNLAHCNRLEPPRDNKLHDADDDDVVILEPKQEHCELVENVSRMSDSVEKFSSREGGIVCVQGYKVKRSVANILKAIFKKHGDIAAECVLKTDSMRSSILEAVCEVAMRVQANDVIEKLEEIESQVSDAKAVNIDVSWLEAHLEAIHKRKEASEMYTLLMKMKADHVSVKKVAQINLRKRRAELVAAQERSKEAKRRVGALLLVGRNLTENFFQS